MTLLLTAGLAYTSQQCREGMEVLGVKGESKRKRVRARGEGEKEGGRKERGKKRERERLR